MKHINLLEMYKYNNKEFKIDNQEIYNKFLFIITFNN